MLRTSTLLAAVLLMPCAATAQIPLVTAARAGAEAFAIGGASVRIAPNGVAYVQRTGDAAFQQLPASDPWLRFRFAAFDPLVSVPRPPAVLGTPTGNALFLVQAKTSVLPEYRRSLTALGLEVVAYIPGQAWLVRGARAQRAAVQAMPWVRWVGDMQCAFKLEEPLLDVVVGAQPAGAPLECNLVLVHKRDRDALAQRVLQLGGVVTNRNEGSTYLQARLTPLQLAAAVAENTVLWVDRTTPIGVDMDNVRAVGGADLVEAQGGLAGQGVRVEITEGLDNAHPDWSNAPLVRFDGLEAHGHCTAAIVGGNGSGMAAARGVMPQSQLIESSVYSWLYAGISRSALIADSVNPVLPWRAMQQTASWGNTHTMSYSSVTQELDDAVFLHDLPVTQSMGNTGTNSARPQAWAKNVLAVGSVSHWNNANPADDIWTDGSIGPAPDGRIKPDMHGYGDDILCGDLVGAAGYSTGNYFARFGGTSAATPMVNGFLGLAQQMFTDGAFHNPLPLPATAANRFANRPHASTARALLMSTAASRDFSGAAHNLTRMHQGWGFPDVARLWQDRDRVLVLDEYATLTHGQQRMWVVWIRPGTAEFRVTMAYSDPAAVPNTTVHRVNDLDLRVTNVDGSQWWHGNQGLLVGNASAPGGARDTYNTVEQVWLKNPAPGVYKIYVYAATIAQDGCDATPELDSSFALVAHPLGGGSHDRSRMKLDILSETPGDLRVRVGNLPATGWVEGFTFLSFDTFSRLGFGSFFGMQADMLAAQIYRVPAVPGDVFHFTNAGAGRYPSREFTFPPAMVLSLSGIAVDGLVTLLGPDGMIYEMSNVARVRLK